MLDEMGNEMPEQQDEGGGSYELIPENTEIPAKAKSWDFDETGTGSTRLRVLFGLLGGDYAGRSMVWDGYFTDKTLARTVESLRHMGWKGSDLSQLEGLDANEVLLVIGQEEYEGKVRNRVRWVNKPGGLYLNKALDESAKKTFAQSMKAKILALELGKPKPPPAKVAARPPPTPPAADGADDIPF